MLLSKGLWFGKGRLLVEGASLGQEVTLDLTVTEDEGGLTLSGELGGEFGGQLSIRVAPDDVGTYVIDARISDLSLDGVAKLESEPNLILLWNAGQTQSVSMTLFRANSGIGCRGFWREHTGSGGGTTRTWEILFKPKQQVVGGSNVVSLNRRR